MTARISKMVVKKGKNAPQLTRFKGEKKKKPPTAKAGSIHLRATLKISQH